MRQRQRKWSLRSWRVMTARMLYGEQHLTISYLKIPWNYRDKVIHMMFRDAIRSGAAVCPKIPWAYWHEDLVLKHIKIYGPMEALQMLDQGIAEEVRYYTKYRSILGDYYPNSQWSIDLTD